MVQVVDDPKSLPLNIPEELALQVTPAQFAILAAENRDLRLERTATGILIVNPPTGGKSGNRNFHLTTQLGIWCEVNDRLGEGFDSSTGFELPNGANRSPDASWVTKARWESLTQEQKDGFVPLCPDFVVELRSKTDSLKKLQEKMQEYMENGAQLGWLIDPQNKKVEIYRSGQPVEILENPSNLSGETILPGFTLSLQRIFSS